MSNYVWVLKKIYEYIPRRSQLKFVLLFVFISLFLWTFTKLSNEQTAKVTFPVKFTETPDLIIIEDSAETKISLTLTSSGLDLFLYSFKKYIKLNLSSASFNKGTGVIDLYKQKFQVQKQLYEGTIINDIDPLLIEFDYSTLGRKKVEVVPDINLSFLSGYDKFNDLKIKPDSIFISGPLSIIDTLKKIPTVSIKYENINKDVNDYVKLFQINPLLKYQTEFVNIDFSVKKFTEKSLIVPINIINLPDSLSIRLFPQVVEVSFSIPLEKAELINSNNFSFTCDYLSSDFGKKDILIIDLVDKPKTANRVKWEPKYVNYLIRE
ncbi:MAG: hypothetical protein VX325_03260 [Bacteroidota bacterium]|nr:hypothetical protein [Bacteroidota bacterium]